MDHSGSNSEVTDTRTIKIDVPVEPQEKTVVLCLANGIAYQRWGFDPMPHVWCPVQTNHNFPQAMTWAQLVAMGELIVLTTPADLERIQR